MNNVNKVLSIAGGIDISGKVGKTGKEVLEKPISHTYQEFSKSASDCITNVQQGIMRVSKAFPELNKYSMACDYFGVDSARNIQNRIENQMALTWAKTIEQDLVNFPEVILSESSTSNAVRNSLVSLMQKKFGRMTITDKLFGNGINEGTHTVGIFYNKGKYFILDSLPETFPQIKDFHERLIKFLELEPKNVVFSKKPQQHCGEYTCNNWAHANLDAVIKFLKSNANEELSPELLNKILPEDINKILDEQFVYTTGSLRGRSIYEFITDSLNK